MASVTRYSAHCHWLLKSKQISAGYTVCLMTVKTVVWDQRTGNWALVGVEGWTLDDGPGRTLKHQITHRGCELFGKRKARQVGTHASRNMTWLGARNQHRCACGCAAVDPGTEPDPGLVGWTLAILPAHDMTADRSPGCSIGLGVCRRDKEEGRGRLPRGAARKYGRLGRRMYRWPP